MRRVPRATRGLAPGALAGLRKGGSIKIESKSLSVKGGLTGTLGFS
jgi:hypothetical protein